MTYVGTVTKAGTVKLPPDAELPEGTKVEVTPLPAGPILTPWYNAADPFANARPIDDLSLLGGYTDDRDADVIIAELRAARQPRNNSR